jgi:hypothetical protein
MSKEQLPKGRKKELEDGRECVRTVGHMYPTIPPEGLSIAFCVIPCDQCGKRQCGKVLPHGGEHICGECDRI